MKKRRLTNHSPQKTKSSNLRLEARGYKAAMLFGSQVLNLQTTALWNRGLKKSTDPWSLGIADLWLTPERNQLTAFLPVRWGKVGERDLPQWLNGLKHFLMVFPVKMTKILNSLNFFLTK